MAELARSPLLVTRDLVLPPDQRAASADPAEVHREIERRVLDLDVQVQNLVAPRGISKTTTVDGGVVVWHLFVE